MPQGNVVIDSSNSIHEKSTLDDIPMVDKVVIICSALNNLYVSVVPFN